MGLHRMELCLTMDKCIYYCIMSSHRNHGPSQIHLHPREVSAEINVIPEGPRPSSAISYQSRQSQNINRYPNNFFSQLDKCNCCPLWSFARGLRLADAMVLSDQITVPWFTWLDRQTDHHLITNSAVAMPLLLLLLVYKEKSTVSARLPIKVNRNFAAQAI